MILDDERLFSHEYVQRSSACYVYCFERLHLLGNSWVKFNFFPIFIPFYNLNSKLNVNSTKERIKDFLGIRKPAKEIEEVLWLQDEYSFNYFHWISEVLPKVITWLELGGSCRTLLLNNNLFSFNYVLESLNLLGFKIIGFDVGDHLKIKRLWTIDHLSRPGKFRRKSLLNLRLNLIPKEILENQVVNEDTSSAIFISRVNAIRRFLVNEEELKPILHKYSIKSIYLEGMSLIDQIKLFSTCKLIISLHGAGLTNMIWMPPGSTVIELRRRDDTTNNCYYSMAKSIGHKYFYVLCENLTQDKSTWDCNLNVPIIDLELTLEKIINSTEI